MVNPNIKLILILILLSTSLTWDYLPTEKGEITVPEVNSVNQNPNITLLSTQKYVITWQSNTSGNQWLVYYIIYGIEGTKVTDPVKVSTDDTITNQYIGIAADDNGGFAIVWNAINVPSMSLNETYMVYVDSSLKMGTPLKIDTAPGSYARGTSPSITFLSGTFLCVYNSKVASGKTAIYVQQVTGGDTSTKVLGVVTVSNEFNLFLYQGVSVDLGNGSFATTWMSNVSAGRYDTFASIYSKTDYSPVKAPWSVCANCGLSAIAYLANDKIIIVWQDSAVRGQIHSKLGVSEGGIVQINTSTSCNNITVHSLGADGFITFYTCSPSGTQVLNYQQYTNDFVKVGIERKVNTVAGSIDSFYRAAVLKGSGVAVSYSNSVTKKTYLKIYYRDSGVCSDFTVMYTDNKPVPITFDLPTSTSIRITTQPINGTLKTAVGTTIASNILVNKTDVIYTPTSTPTSDIFFFSTNNVDNPCKVTLTYVVCHTSCATCQAAGDSTDHKCSTCKANDYFPMEEKPTDCFKADEVSQDYRLQNGKWRKCNELCKTCTGYSTDPSNMLCESNSCVNGYYPKFDNMTSCYQSIESYFLDENFIYQKCHELCKSCAGYPVDASSDMKCNSDSCISGYYPKDDNMTSCYKGTIPEYRLDGKVYKKINCYSLCKTCTALSTYPSVDMLCTSCIPDYHPMVGKMTGCFKGDFPGYFFDGSIYQKCYELCDTCNGYPDDATTDMLCKTCPTGSFPREGNMTSCFKGDMDLYYLDSKSKTYKKCSDSCLTCVEGPDGDKHNCKKCKDKYYPLDGKSGFCFKEKDTVVGYYFNNSIFGKCHESCKTCTGRGTPAQPNCIECDEDFKTCSGCDYVFEGQCVEKCPKYSIYNSTTKLCTACKKGELIFNNECIPSCLTGYIQDSDTCITCQSKQMLTYKDSCVKQCPSDTKLNQSAYACEEICPNGIYVKNKGCVTCASLSKFLFNGECVDKCPENTSQEDSKCQPILSTKGKYH
jgi:hypothetical protein